MHSSSLVRWTYVLFGLAWLLVWVLPYVGGTMRFAVGQPAPFTVVAPRQIAVALQPSVAATDASLYLSHLHTFTQILDYITTLRNATHLSPEEKVEDLLAVAALNLTREETHLLLGLPEDAWNRVRDVAPNVLAQALQRRLPATTEALSTLMDTIPTFASLSLGEQGWVLRLVGAYLKSVAPEETAQRIYRPGEPIVLQGQPVDKVQYQALRELGLAAPPAGDASRFVTLGPIFLVIVWMHLLGFYTWRLAHKESILRPALMYMLLFLAILAWLRGTFLLYRLSPPLGLILPLSLFGMLVLYTSNDVLWALLWGWGLHLSLWADFPVPGPYLIFHNLILVTGLLLLSRRSGLRDYVQAAFGFSLIAIWTLLGFLPQIGLSWREALLFIPGFIFYGFFLATLLLFGEYLFQERFAGLSALRLSELTRPDHPLLVELMQRAPGTYQHAQNVALMMEQAANALGLDPLLCRVGALYHDIGKLIHPDFFIENQMPTMTNPIDQLDPYAAAELIREHVTHGLELAAQFRLPRRIRDFIAEHHGTTLIFTPYRRAVEMAGGDPARVPIERFTYPGPKPRSKETALLMLADICEARVRAANPETPETLREVVWDSIMMRVREKELDHAGLSIEDLGKIEEAFVHALLGIHHQRIRYEQPVHPIRTLSTERSHARPMARR